MSFSVTVEALDLGDPSQFFLDSIGVNTCYRRVVVILSLVSLVPTTSMMVVVVLLASLTLVDRRLLMLTTRRISGKNIIELSSLGVFVLLLHKLVLLGILRVHLAGT